MKKYFVLVKGIFENLIRNISNEGASFKRNENECIKVIDLDSIKKMSEKFFDEYSDIFNCIQLPVCSDYIHIGGGGNIKLFITKRCGTYIMGCTVYVKNFCPINDSHIMYYHTDNKSKSFCLSQCDEYTYDVCKNFEALLSNVEKQLKAVQLKAV